MQIRSIRCIFIAVPAGQVTEVKQAAINIKQTFASALLYILGEPVQYYLMTVIVHLQKAAVRPSCKCTGRSISVVFNTHSLGMMHNVQNPASQSKQHSKKQRESQQNRCISPGEGPLQGRECISFITQLLSQSRCSCRLINCRRLQIRLSSS